MSLRRPPIPVVFRLLAGLLLLAQSGCMSALTTAAMRDALRDTVDSLAVAAASDEVGSNRDADASAGVVTEKPADDSRSLISEPKPPSLDESVNQAIARLKSVGELDAQTQATLLSILEKTSPEDWPAAIDAFAASLEAYRPPPRVDAPVVVQPATQTAPAEPAADAVPFEPPAERKDQPSADNQAAMPLVFPAMPTTPVPSRLVVVEAARSVGLGADESVEDGLVFATGTTPEPTVAPEAMTFPGLKETPAETPDPQVVTAPQQLFEFPATSEEPAVADQPAVIAPPTPTPPALAVQNASFVSRVRAWGVVEKFPEAVFRPGQDVIAYFELDALAARRSPAGHSTSVKTTFQLFDSDGRQVGQWDFDPIDETCLTSRRDYFARYFIRIPETAAPGPHRLEIMVNDLVGGVSARARLDLEVRP